MPNGQDNLNNNETGNQNVNNVQEETLEASDTNTLVIVYRNYLPELLSKSKI
jgi:hypothetical protein